jgi:menaquinone-specific isochorismate synthase
VPPLPQLRAVTRPLEQIPALLTLTDPQHPMVWTRGDRGCVGVGEALRLSFTGPDRFAQAASAWRAVAEAAQIDDTVRLPGSGLVALGSFAFADDSAESSVLIVPRVLVARHRDVAWLTVVSEWSEPSPAPTLPGPVPAGLWPGVALAPGEDADLFRAAVAEASTRIAKGAADKIVLSRQLAGVVSNDADLRVPIGRLADRYLDCWTFAIDGLVGASPETLIRSAGGSVSARVLAGTRPRGADAGSDAHARDTLLTSDKDQHEHAFAIDSVTAALSPHVRDLTTSEQPFALELPNVWHLATDVGARLADGATSIELAGALHPTAAIAGTPTPVAVAAIGEIENFDRGRYSGAVGWTDATGDGEWVIALRCAQFGEVSPTGERTIIASAGGGIVAGSDAERELAETISKFRPVVEAFAAAG